MCSSHPWIKAPSEWDTVAALEATETMDAGLKVTKQCAQGDVMHLNEEVHIRSVVLRWELDLGRVLLSRLLIYFLLITHTKKVVIALEAQRIFDFFVSKYRCNFTPPARQKSRTHSKLESRFGGSTPLSQVFSSEPETGTWWRSSEYDSTFLRGNVGL